MVLLKKKSIMYSMAKSKFRVIISTLLFVLCFNSAKAADADELLAWIDMPENAAAKAYLTDPANFGNDATKVWTVANVANLGSWFGVTVTNGNITGLSLTDPLNTNNFAVVPNLNLPYLTDLTIRSKNLAQVSNLSNLTALTSLMLTGNPSQGEGKSFAPLSEVPTFNLPNIKRLSIAATHLSKAPNVSLLPQLNFLDLGGNMLGYDGSAAPDYSVYNNLFISLNANYYNYNSFVGLPATYLNSKIYISNLQIASNTLSKTAGGVYVATPGGNPANTTYTWEITPPANSGITPFVYQGLGNNGFSTYDPTNSNNPATYAPSGSKVLLKIQSPDWFGFYNMILYTTFTIGSPLFLPVNFDNVMATLKNGKLQVNWATLTETNNSHFDVEVSKDGKTFTKLTTLQSKATGGNSTQKTDYEVVTDLQKALAVMGIPALLALLGIAAIEGKKRRFSVVLFSLIVLTAISYTSCNKSKEQLTDSKDDAKLFVRIKQTDKDGSFKYSKVVQAVNE